MTDLICIVCPKGCRLRARRDGGGVAVTGQGCARGEDYARAELTHPTRVITSTVRLAGTRRRLPVKTGGAIPKALIMDAMRALRGVYARPPVRVGDVVLPDVCGTGVDFVATRNVE